MFFFKSKKDYITLPQDSSRSQYNGSKSSKTITALSEGPKRPPLCLRHLYFRTFRLFLNPPWCTTFLPLDSRFCDFGKGPLNINDKYLPFPRAVILPLGASCQRLTPPHCHGQHRNHPIWTCLPKGIPHGRCRCRVCREGHIVLRLAEVWLHSMPPLREGDTKLSRI